MSDEKCPTPERILALYEDGLAEVDARAVEDHLASCELCAAYADEVARPSILSVAGMVLRSADVAFPPSPSVGRYRFDEEIGRGGMGVVYRAVDPRLGRNVAIKVVHRGLADTPVSIARYEVEARAMARLDHPGIVRIHDVIEDLGRIYLVMEFVPGTPLSKVGRVAPATAARYVRDAADAIAHMHEAGLIHRDLKPGNLIRAAADGRVKVLDFGIARGLDPAPGSGPLTSPGIILGTPEFMAPEQLAGSRAAGPPVDVYALGCTLYALIHGHPPRLGVAPPSRPPADGPRSAKPVAVPRAIKSLLRRMLAPDPAGRPTAAAVAAALAAFVGEGGGPDRWSHPRRAAWWARLAMLAGAFVIAGLVARPWISRQPPAQAQAPTEVKADARPALLVARGRPKHYASIVEALKKAGPGSVIRVVDDATYEEPIRFVPARHTGVTLEATAGATLAGPADDWAVVIDGVPGLVVRGFRLRRPQSTNRGLIWMSGQAPGVLLDRLDLETPGDGGDGIRILGRTAAEGDAPAVIRRCRIAGGRRGIAVVGRDVDDTRPLAGGNVRIEDNTFTMSPFGIGLSDELRRVMMAGNRFEATKVAIQINALKAGSGDILVGNNTFLDVDSALQYWRPIDEPAPIGGLAFVANLILGRNRGDMLFIDGEPGVGDLIGYLDGRTFASTWRLGRNVREGRAPDRSTAWARGWVPPGPTDVLANSVAGIDRNLSHGKYLQPAETGGPSQVASIGAADPGMPTYTGAVPPAGMPAWDWEQTWAGWSRSWKPLSAGPDPAPAMELITVSRKYAADFDNLADALARKRDPALGRTIRVLDDETYEESLALDREHHSFLTIEAPRGATLKPTQPDHHGILVDQASHVVLRGIRFRGLPTRNYAYVFVAGPAPGLYLDRLHFEGGRCNGVWFENAALPDDEDPAIVWNCQFERLETGLGISATDRPCRRIRVVGNVFSQANAWLSGPMQSIHLVGNLFSRTNGSAMTLWPDPARSGRLLVANNTFWECHGVACLLADGPPPDLPIGRFCNNLMVATSDDDLIAHRPGPDSTHEPADGTAVPRCWRFDHNWRGVCRSQGNAAYVPLGAEDRIDATPPVASTNIDDTSFLKPNPGSALATGGAGGTGPPLPTYVGGVPPTENASWQWDGTWSSRH